MKLSTLASLTALLFALSAPRSALAAHDDTNDTHCILSPDGVPIPLEGYSSPSRGCFSETCLGEGNCTRTIARDGTACFVDPRSETSPVGGCSGGECLPAAAPEACGSSAPATCTVPPPPLASLPDISQKWELALPPAVSATTGDVVDVSAVLTFKSRGGAIDGAMCSARSLVDASLALRAKVLGITEAFALQGGGQMSECRGVLCLQPPAYSCATEGGCRTMSGYLNGSFARTSEVDLSKKLPLLEKLGRVRASLGYGIGVGIDAAIREGVPTGPCTECCANGATNGDAALHLQLGAKGTISTRLSLFGSERFAIDLGGSATACAQVSAGLATTCDGGVRPRGDGQIYLAVCLDTALGRQDASKKITSRWSNNSDDVLRIPISDFFDLDIELPRCVKTGQSSLCPAAL